MTEEKNEREQYRELNMVKHASSSSLQSTKKKFFCEEKNAPKPGRGCGGNMPAEQTSRAMG